jgi:hypothetical protein
MFAAVALELVAIAGRAVQDPHVAVIVLALTTFTAVPAAPPKVTLAPAWKLDPVMVTGVPPSAEV